VSEFSADLSKVTGTSNNAATNKVADKSTNKKAGKDLDMTDFLTLMVATLQNQTMDNTADTGEMMNQMVQMSVISAVTQLTDLLNESTALTYAASLVGKEVTIGQYDAVGDVKELVRTITGTGTLGGKQVVFTKNPQTGEDESYYLTDVMAVGRLPDDGIKLPGSTEDAQTGQSTGGV